MPRFVVCVKQALDVAEIKIDKTANRPITAGVPFKVSDFDKNAIEAAVNLKEGLGADCEVVLVAVATPEARTILKEGLAMGADRAYLLTDPAFEGSDASTISLILTRAIEKIGYDLVLCGEASIDGFSAQIGPSVAERLGVPQMTYVKKLSIDAENTLTAERALEDCTQLLRTHLPTLITVTKELNEPRIPTYMDIIKASKKSIEVWGINELGLQDGEVGEPGSKVQVLSLHAPLMKRGNVIIKSDTLESTAEELATALFKEGVIRGGV